MKKRHLSRLHVMVRLTTLALLSLLITSCSNKQYCYPDPEINSDNLEASVRYLTDIKPARNHKHPGSLKKAADFISQKLSEYGLEPTEQSFTVSGQTYVNIVASVGPQKGGRIVVGAHYDVCDEQAGADDNASGVAGLLEVARFAKEHEEELAYSVDFVAFASEEPPFFGTSNMGSYIHAESLYKKNITVKGMISLEMIGFYTDNDRSQNYPLSLLRWFYPSKGSFVGVVGNFSSSTWANNIARHLRKTAIQVRTLKAPSFLTGVDFSDHRNYWRFGYDAVMVTDTAFYRNPNYHKTTDTIDTLNFDQMREVVKGISWSILNAR